MHLSPLRLFGRRAAPRRHVHSADQHHQREDLRFPMVLVLLDRDCLRLCLGVPPCHNRSAFRPHLGDSVALPLCEPTSARFRRRPLQGGRLVHSAPAGQEPRSAQLQRLDRRILRDGHREEGRREGLNERNQFLEALNQRKLFLETPKAFSHKINPLFHETCKPHVTNFTAVF